MAYTTQQALVDRFGELELIQLTDRNNTGVIDTTVITRAIEDTDAEINGYLEGRYTLPLVEAPEVLVRIAVDIARYHLHVNAVSDVVKERYDNAINYLKLVASGKVSLGANAQGDQPTKNSGAQIDSGGKVFGRSDNGFL